MDFTTTPAGRTAAFNAGVAGLKIEVTSFRLGSGSGYVPDSLVDNGMHGTVVYTGAPTGFSVVDGDTCEFLLEVPASAGTFDFGEVELQLADGTVFALAALPGLQQKIAAPGSGANTVFIRARLHLVGINAIIQWTSVNVTAGVIIELANYSLLMRPDVAGSNIFLVHEADDQENDALVHRNGDGTWDVSTHTRLVSVAGALLPLAGATSSAMVLTGKPDLEPGFPPGQYLIQAKSGAQRGQIRKITAAVGLSLSWAPAFGAPLQPTDTFEILQSTVSFAASEGQEHAFFNALSVRSL